MYKRRIKIFLAVMAVVLACLAVKLVDLQVIHGQEYRRQFELTLITTDLLPMVRGRILDRDGKVLAEDKQCYDFCLDYRFIVQDAKWAAQQVATIRKNEGRTQAQAEDIFERRVQNTWALARELCDAHHVDMQAQMDRICRRVDEIRRRVEELNPGVRAAVKVERVGHALVQVDEASGAGETVGASFEPSLKRWYPYGDLACHVIGVTGPVSQAECNLLNLNPSQADRLARIYNNYLEGDSIGKSGVEKMCERALRGQRGYLRTRRGGEVVEMQEARRGSDVTLSIDAEMQDYLARIFFRRGVQGAGVVISVPTGEVLAMVSAPTYDLNRFREDYEMLSENKLDLPLIHRAVARRYPPGSTAKVFAAIAGLASGLTPQTRYTCQGALDPKDPHTLHCSSLAGHGSLDLIDAIKHSCNIYFYNVGRHVGAVNLADWFERFGYGSPTFIGLSEEVGGNVPRGAVGRGDPMQWAIGQGALDATPLQVANAYAAIARSDCEYVSPVLIKDAEPAVRRKAPVRADYLDAVRKGMWKVINEPGGTGYGVFREELTAGEKVPPTCGKTGTADCEPMRMDINGDGRVSRDEIVRQGNMAWFAGYSPDKDPRVAFAIVVEYVPGHGGKEAGPIARELMVYCQAKGYLGR